MILAVLVFTIASVLFELMILWKMGAVREMVKRYGWLGFLLSFAISWILSIVFPAHGFVILAAAVLSTVLVQPVYSWLNWRHRKAQEKAQTAPSGGRAYA